MTLPEQIVYLTAFATEHAAGRPSNACHVAMCALSAAKNHARPVHGDPHMREALGMLPAAPPAEQARRDNVEAIIAEAMEEIHTELTGKAVQAALAALSLRIEQKLGRPLRGR
jgi:hypothetical protein